MKISISHNHFCCCHQHITSKIYFFDLNDIQHFIFRLIVYLENILTFFHHWKCYKTDNSTLRVWNERKMCSCCALHKDCVIVILFFFNNNRLSSVKEKIDKNLFEKLLKIHFFYKNVIEKQLGWKITHTIFSWMMAVEKEKNNKRYQRVINLTRKELHFQITSEEWERERNLCKDNEHKYMRNPPSTSSSFFNDAMDSRRNAKNINSFSNE